MTDRERALHDCDKLSLEHDDLHFDERGMAVAAVDLIESRMRRDEERKGLGDEFDELD